MIVALVLALLLQGAPLTMPARVSQIVYAPKVPAPAGSLPVYRVRRP